MRRAPGLMAFAFSALVLASQPAWAQRPEPELPVFGHTLQQGSGYIVTPHALVARSSLFVTGTVIAPEGYQPFTTSTKGTYTVTRAAGGLTLARFLEVGLYGGSVEGLGAFGKIQLVKQSGVFPSIAAGVQNLTYADNGRYGIEDPFYDDLKKRASIYGVFTYVAGPGRGVIPSWVTISLGWGSGLFFEDNPQVDDDTNSSGLFGAVSADFQAADRAFIRVVGEFDGFDVNVGVMAYLEGMELSVGLLSAGKGEANDPQDPAQPLEVTNTFAGSFYNQVKPYVSLTIDFRALGAIPWIWTGEEE